MAPISWLTLFIMFTITFMMFNVLNYYCFNKTNKTISTENNLKTNNNSLNWKW
nr:ATP synthase F0 subunit 8 [Limnophyes sp. YF-2022]